MKAIKYIKKIVCDYYGTPNINKGTRKREVVQVRQICHYLAKEYTDCSLSVIGRDMGGMNHATVLYGENVIRDILTYDKKMNIEISEISNKIEAYINQIPKNKRYTRFHNNLSNKDVSFTTHYNNHTETIHSSIISKYIRLSDQFILQKT